MLVVFYFVPGHLTCVNQLLDFLLTLVVVVADDLFYMKLEENSGIHM